MHLGIQLPRSLGAQASKSRSGCICQRTTRRPLRSVLCVAYAGSLSTGLPAEFLRYAVGATLASSIPQASVGLYHAAQVWSFTSACALSVALGAVVYRLFAHVHELALLHNSFTQPEEERHVVHGVDVTGSKFFKGDLVQRALAFAEDAHKEQFRKTGEPYVTHCIETALIVEHNLPFANEEDRYQAAIAAALLHDVIDDTNVELSAIEAAFGPVISNMVYKVSNLSKMNQLLRRCKRTGLADYSQEHLKQLKKMIVDMVFEEPLVILIKLADRLHNMRTVYVLAPEKQRAVAEETMQVWCSMAEYLGWDGLKSEMEDLCFAVTEPDMYLKLRNDLDRLWNLKPINIKNINDAVINLLDNSSSSADVKPGSVPQPTFDGVPSSASRLLAPFSSFATLDADDLQPTSPVVRQTAAISGSGGVALQVLEKPLLSMNLKLDSDDATVAFPAAFPSNWKSPDLAYLRSLPDAADLAKSQPSSTASAPKDPNSVLSAQQLHLKFLLETVVPFDAVNFKTAKGLGVMTQRGLEVLDQCANVLRYEIGLRSYGAGLRVFIQGRLKSLYSVSQKMMRKKCSVSEVYDARALRVIVDDEGGERLQDAIEACYKLVHVVHSIWKPILREFDDYIANPKGSGYQALHTAVKGPCGIAMEVQIKTLSMHEHAEYGWAAHWVYKEYMPILPTKSPTTRLPPGYVGQPVLRISDGKLRYGVVLKQGEGKKELLCVIKTGGTFENYPTRVPDYAFYKALLQYSYDRSYTHPGCSDMNVRLEEYVMAKDGRYHRRDHMGTLQGRETLTLLEGYEDAVLNTNSVEVVDKSFVERTIDEEVEDEQQRRQREQLQQTYVRTQQLRSMIEWGREAIGKYASVQSDEVSVLIWPGGRIEHFPRGTTAGEIIASQGYIDLSDLSSNPSSRSKVVNVNNTLVPLETVLNDGDLVILSREKVKI